MSHGEASRSTRARVEDEEGNDQTCSPNTQNPRQILTASPYQNLGLLDTEAPLISFESDDGNPINDFKTFTQHPLPSQSLLDDDIILSPSVNTPKVSFDDIQFSGVLFPPVSSVGVDKDIQPQTGHDNSTSDWKFSDLEVDTSQETSQKETNAGAQCCPECEQPDLELFYCNLCDYIYCARCWDKVGPHRMKRLGPGGIPHEKTDQDIADKLRAAFEALPSEAEQELLHEIDEITAWFGVIKDEHGDSIFHDYGRYADIMTKITNVSQGRLSNCFPGMVCFVGETGAGKSTLIKVLIELSQAGKSVYQTPIVGSNRNENVPTSGDVHLYTDPKSFLSDNPLFYADCEGLNGGERVPKGARSRLLQHMDVGNNGRSKTTRSFDRNRRNLDHSSEREVTWATTSEKQTREFAVTHLYPRLLYTFSDVVVFVLKNPRVIENVIERLIEWAEAALEMSSNQPVLPHAIIVLNASELSIDPQQWEVEFATAWLMSAVNESISRNVKFRRHASTWRSRGKEINCVEDLLLVYYSSVQVVRIPTLGRPKLIEDQMARLYDQITISSDAAKKSKRDLRMLLDADELQPYLQFAFDHFSRNLDLPFDFVQASFIYNPIPSDFAGNILKLAVNMMEIWQDKLDGERIFNELAYMVASCIMLDSARNKTRGGAELIFPEYVEHCDNALEDFCDRYWPCEFVLSQRSKSGKEFGGRCVNVRSGHGSKGHQFANGKVVSVGSYQSAFSFDTHLEKFRNTVYHYLKELLGELRETVDENQPEIQMAAQIHRSRVMTHFYERVTGGKTEKLASHSICLSCLMNLPEHALPCGHIICTPCLQAYGNLLEKDVIEITSCPLHFESSFRSWRVYLKPQTAGVRVLSLDGGGIRGIAELEILRQIEQVWGGKLQIQDFFDLIVGTSTGGLIALGLAAKGWSVQQCIWNFESLCNKAFTRRFGGNIPGLSMFVESYHHSKYETKPLHEALQQAYGNDYLFGGSRFQNTRLKVAVTATVGGSVSVLANYNRNCSTKLPYTFQRPDKLAAELKVWEAGRATSAAPRIFKPFSHEPSKQVYIDGAVYHNNPIQIADIERKLLWPSDGPNIPDFVLSLGTTYSPSSRKKLIEKAPISSVGIVNHAKILAIIAIDHIKSSLDSEKTWQDYILQLSLPRKYSDRYERINPMLLEDPPALDEVFKMKDLQQKVRVEMDGNMSIHRAAHRLVASSFYLELTSHVQTLLDGTSRYTGQIKCRLPRHAMLDLGRFLRDSHDRSHGPYFIIREQDRPKDAQQIFITPRVIDRMILRAQWKLDPVPIKVSHLLASTEIVLCVEKDEEFPISGFPRALQQEDARSGLRPDPDKKTERWRTRTASQQKRRKKWTQPLLSEEGLSTENRLKGWSPIRNFSAPGYLIGNSTVDSLEDTKVRLGHDLETPTPSTSGIFEMADTSIPRHELGDTSLRRDSQSPINSITDSSSDVRSDIFISLTSEDSIAIWREGVETIHIDLSD